MRLIDADAFIQFLKDAVKRQKYELLKIDEFLTVADVIDAVISDLDGTSLDGFKNAPTIEERKTGKWLPDNNSVYEMRFICSECRESQVVPTIGFTKYKPIWDFCPNCGAMMEG